MKRFTIINLILIFFIGAACVAVFIIQPGQKTVKKIKHIGLKPVLKTMKGEVVAIEPDNGQITLKVGMPARRRTIFVKQSDISLLKIGDLVRIKMKSRRDIAVSVEVVNDEKPKKPKKEKSRGR